MNRTGRLILLATLAIAPLCVGSYFGIWRWPALIASSFAIFFLLLGSFFTPADETPKKRDHNSPKPPSHTRGFNKRHLGLLGLLLVPIIQGIWMYYNAWGVFTPEPWSIMNLATQPVPWLPGTVDQTEAWDRLSYIIPCLGLIWVTSIAVRTYPSIMRAITSVIFWSGVAVAMLGLLQRWTGAEGIFWTDALTFSGRGLFFGTYRSPGIATASLNIAFALGLSSILTIRRPKENLPRTGTSNVHLFKIIFTLLGNIILLIAILSAGSKAGMFLGLTTLILWAVMNRRSITLSFHRSKEVFPGSRPVERNIIVIAILCISLLGVASFYETMATRWTQAQESSFSTLTSRIIAYEVQIDMLQDNEWGALGFGPGSFYPLFDYYYYAQQDGGSRPAVWVYAHNDYLQTLIEWGWLGTTAFAAIILLACFFLIREIFFQKANHKKSHIILFRSYLIAIAIVLLHATLDFPFQIESIAITISVILGIAWGCPNMRTTKQKAQRLS